MKIRINKELENEFLRIALLPYEAGGVMGKKEDIIFVQDQIEETHMNEYIPNVDNINSILDEWFKEGIKFIGILHSHLNGCYMLSDIDIEYFRRIMKENKMRCFIAPVVTLIEEDLKLVFYKITKNNIKEIRYIVK